MAAELVGVVTAEDPAVRDLSLAEICADLTREDLLTELDELEQFRHRSANLYERVRALLFQYAIHRFHLPPRIDPGRARIPWESVQHLWTRRFEEAIEGFLRQQGEQGPSEAISSALAAAYRALGFQTLADQVRASVRSVEGNAWMFAVESPTEHPLRVHDELLTGAVLRESTPVRMDLTHSGWSDIFFLGMDHPEGARVLNVSIDLAVRGRDAEPRPPIETFLRVIDEPVLRLRSVDLGAEAEVGSLAELFDFARDYLGLLKAAVIASGIVPPSLEGSDATIGELLESLVGPGRGLEITSRVRGIPKGSRLAVSTNLLASLIALGMRATRQTSALEGPLRENERRLVAARAILGEWLGGSGGGWQDSGGLWPAIKLIEGAAAQPGDPEHGVSRGRLLPEHRLLDGELSVDAQRALRESVVLVHGGMAQDVGPILEMVTERYLLRSEPEWSARRESLEVLDEIVVGLASADLRAVGAATTRHFRGPITTMIPWASNLYTERLIEAVSARFGDGFWGFCMHGGMSGGGMGFSFAPEVRPRALEELPEILRAEKRRLEHAVPFAMEPVVYDFAVDEHGSVAELVDEPPAATEAEEHDPPEPATAVRSLEELLDENGFDPEQHEQIRADLVHGRIGLARNRLPAHTAIEDVHDEDVVDARDGLSSEDRERGLEALRAGEVAVVTLAGGSGSRWTRGAGVVKALDPFCRLAGEHRTFLDVHRAKCRRASEHCGTALPQVVTTSWLTHDAIEEALAASGDDLPVILSRGRSIGLRLIPMERDLRFAWEETAAQVLDERAQKVRESLQAALIRWARQHGEGADYRDNLPRQCIHPVGHGYEVPNLLKSGALARLLADRPGLSTLMLHNVDTLGADVDPALLGHHLRSGTSLTFEVVARRLEDRGGGLARVDGHPRLVESLALPREEAEFALTLYNTMTTWIDVDGLLALFDLGRDELGDEARVAKAVRAFARRLPTYVTLKDVKKRWGHGHEDVYPVAQWEKLWSDVTLLPEARCGYVVVPRARGQQLKDPEQLDGWLRDGSADYVRRLGWG